jgi:hypothetical protein
MAGATLPSPSDRVLSSLLALLFADDVALLAESPEALQAMLDVCSDWAQRRLLQPYLRLLSILELYALSWEELGGMTDYSKWQALLRERITEGIRAWVTAGAHRTGMDTLVHQKAFNRVRYPQCSKPLPAYFWMPNESFFGVRLRPLWSGRLFDPRKRVHYSPLMILGFGLVLAHLLLPHLLVSS